jgi:hypothetical protein
MFFGDVFVVILVVFQVLLESYFGWGGNVGEVLEFFCQVVSFFEELVESVPQNGDFFLRMEFGFQVGIVEVFFVKVEQVGHEQFDEDHVIEGVDEGIAMKRQYRELLKAKDRGQDINGLDLVESEIEEFEFLVELDFGADGLNRVVRYKEFFEIL